MAMAVLVVARTVENSTHLILLDRAFIGALEGAVGLLGTITKVIGEVAELDRAPCKPINEFLVPYGMTT